MESELLPQALEDAFALPATFYTNPQIAARERDCVFARHWQLVAHVDQVREAGDHAIAEVAGVPLLIVRGDDGELRALHNVCRHRAGPLATCEGRGAKALRCKYHGWTYRLDGQLRSAPEMEGACGFDASAIRLPQARVAQWQNLVFAALESPPAITDVLAGIDARIGAHPLASYVFDRRTRYEIGCNWKAYVDNYLEGYHVPHIHPALNRMLDYRSYTTTLAPWHSLQFSPLESADALYGNGDALYYFIWPNIMLNILPGRLQTNRVVPLAPDRCRVDFDYFYPAGRNDAAHRTQDEAFSDEVQREDIAICELVQHRLASGSYTAGRLNPRRESGVWHFHEMYRAALRADA
ncbi:MAG: aromatic ring-hydroxylating dioxygenase subunit alpha [Proteobacteria bacterium]|nr:aromatic ring-hydroxylating dioxygenase subunit alpha [Pseudomonadota bacterium]